MFLPPEPWPLPLRVIVLAAQRRGTLDPLARRFAVTHKCLVPIGNRALIAHVVAMLSDHPQVSNIAVSVEEAAFPEIRGALACVGHCGQVQLVASQDNITDSVAAAAIDHEGPLIVTTADNVLLDPRSIDAVLGRLLCSEAVVAMTTREAVLATHADGQRRFYQFADGAYSNCNLYGLGSRQALSAAETFRAGGQFAKRAYRIVQAFGILNLLLFRLGLLTLGGAFARISRRLGLRVVPVVLDEGSQAIDVDNDRTYAVAEHLLGAREAASLQDGIPQLIPSLGGP